MDLYLCTLYERLVASVSETGEELFKNHLFLLIHLLRAKPLRRKTYVKKRKLLSFKNMFQSQSLECFVEIIDQQAKTFCFKTIETQKPNVNHVQKLKKCALKCRLTHVLVLFSQIIFVANYLDLFYLIYLMKINYYCLVNREKT